MPAFELNCEIELPVPIEQAFQVFEDPYNLAAITPPELGFRIISKGLSMKKGAQIDYSFRWLVLRLKWKTLISVYEPPYQFIDEALESPYSYWRHRHTFRATERGTLVSDRVSYGLPFGPIGSWAQAWSVRGQLLHIFNYRQQAIARLLQVTPLSVKAPVIAPGKPVSKPDRRA